MVAWIVAWMVATQAFLIVTISPLKSPISAQMKKPLYLSLWMGRPLGIMEVVTALSSLLLDYYQVNYTP